MKVAQLYSLTNTVVKEVLGETTVVAEDLSNIADIGKSVIDSDMIDNYVKSLIDHIGRTTFVDRKYNGNAPTVLMDSWEYGAIREKITMDSLPEATENESWNLQNGHSYDQQVFYKPTVSAKFYDSKTTYEVPMSFTQEQLKSSFSNAEELNGFVSMIQTGIDNALTIRISELIMRTINRCIIETNADTTGVRKVKLLSMYNAQFGATLTAEQALLNPEFIKFASYTLGLYIDRLASLSTLFNEGKKERFTTSDKLHVVLLSQFANAASAYLQSETFHDQYVALPEADKVAFWQGSGTGYSFAECSKVSGYTTTADNTVTVEYVIGVMFDHEALGVSNSNRRVTSSYNAKAEFYNNYYKVDASYFTDFNENFVMFVIE